MINLDKMNVVKAKELESNGIYIAGTDGNVNIKSVLLDGKELQGVMYCDVNNGVVLIYTKTTRDGFTHELLFGDVEIIFEDLANDQKI